MLLLAVAVVCIGLGWHSASSKSSNPVTTATTDTLTTAPSTTVPTTSASSTANAANRPAVCVFNAGTTKGLARKVADELEAAGWKIQEVSNLQTSSITDNTVFYNRKQTQYIADLVSTVTASKEEMDERTPALSSCPDSAIALVVVQ